MKDVNLTAVSSKDASTQNRGKVVLFKGKWIYHQWIQAKWERRDIEAWGIDTAVLDYLETHGIHDVYLFSAKQGRTYHTSAPFIRTYGTPANRGEWGENLNLPIEEWTVTEGKLSVPWVPDSASIRLQPSATKPLITRSVSPESEPGITQEGLL